MVGFLKSLFGKKEGQAVAADKASTAAPTSTARPVHVTDESFEAEVLNASVPALVDFWAPWCGPCRMVAPVVEELAQAYDGRLLVAKINTDENVQVAGRLDIMGIPTLILFKDGREVDRVVGYAPRHVLEEKLKFVVN